MYYIAYAYVHSYIYIYHIAYYVSYHIISCIYIYMYMYTVDTIVAHDLGSLIRNLQLYQWASKSMCI